MDFTNYYNKSVFVSAVSINAVIIVGVLAFKWSLLTALLVNQVNLWTGMTRAIQPLIRHHSSKEGQNQVESEQEKPVKISKPSTTKINH